MMEIPDYTSVSELNGQKGYAQSLEDYGITNVLKALQQIHPTLLSSESSLIINLLMNQFSQVINPELIDRYLHTIRNGQQNYFNAPITLEYPPSINLPDLSKINNPCYSIGTKVRLTPIDGAAEWGTLVGYYLCYSLHHCKWMYRYILFLDQTSPSAAWIKSSFAWEDEIECRLGELHE
jgi:hypothetical protein